jgi:hypothetical protein
MPEGKGAGVEFTNGDEPGVKLRKLVARFIQIDG